MRFGLWSNTFGTRKVIKLDTILKTRNLIDFSLRLFSQRSSCPKYVPLWIRSAWFVVVRDRWYCATHPTCTPKIAWIQFVHGLPLVLKVVEIQKNVGKIQIYFLMKSAAVHRYLLYLNSALRTNMSNMIIHKGFAISINLGDDFFFWFYFSAFYLFIQTNQVTMGPVTSQKY